ncbi:MAG: hypothetical protein KME60_23480 [Cyanomargarita calcarea GSE-NOS-MK-12-04C]|jgi:hypothetical protein|uniref:Uncharacterized protein n=1 Tax=Cyanomargarita calcarea GSE-NOS-MK-12-04C TaxID=2839659 RepID=A0A951QQL1_9CYAN|nr:hypothetical protein [Cyanomargarita calcarea GSE-NOS-MK-12-04C]
MKLKPYIASNIMTQLLKTKSLKRKINKLSAVGLVACSLLTISFLPPESSYASSIFNKSDDTAQTKQKSGVRGSYKDFFTALARRETGQQNPPTNIENQLGFIGKYQFGEALLKDLGYYDTPNPYIGGGNGVDRNYWRGTWRGKNGINSKQDFLNNKNNVQEIAIQEAMQYKWGLIKNQLNGRSIKEFIGQKRGGVVVTPSGILAAAHLRGERGVANLLLSNQGSTDENGTSILAYLREFAGFKTPFD